MLSEDGAEQGDADGAGPSVFVSYSHLDQKAALPVVRALERAGHSVWWDQKLEGGERYLRTTEAALEGARAVVVLWSQNSVTSHWVHDEAMRGRDRNCLVPLTIDGAEPPLGFRQFQVIDLARPGRKAKAEGLDAMVRAVGALLGGTRSSPAIDTWRSAQTGAASVRAVPLWAWLIVAVALLGAAGWWLLRPGPMRTPTVALARFEAVGAGVPSELPASLDSELRAALGEQDVALQSGPADLALGGTVQRMGETLRFTVRLDHVASGTTLWTSTSDQPLAQPVAQVAGSVAGIVGCAVERSSSYRGELPLATQDLLLDYCDADTPGRQLDLARRMARASPDFFGAWTALANSVGRIEVVIPPEMTPALRAEGEAAARRAIELDPESAEGYNQLAALLPPNRPVEREAMLRRAISVRPEDCQCSYQHFGDFLLQAGRTEEAIAMYRRGLDQDRVAPLAHWRSAMGQYVAGRTQQAEDRMRIAASGNRPLSKRARYMAAVWSGRWAEAAELVEADRQEEADAVREAMLAMASGDRAGIDRAGAGVAAIPLRLENETLLIPTLALLGRVDAAMAGLEWSRRRGGLYSAPGRVPGLTRPLVFDPRLRPLFTDPRFPAFLQRAGFIAYWRQSRTRPDVCRAAGAPPFCRLLR